MTIAAVLVNGDPLDFEDVEYDIRITHARDSIKSPPEASTAQVIIRGPVGVELEVADELRIGAYAGVCRFRGTITDLNVDTLSTTPPTTVTTVTAIGFLAKLGYLTTGEDTYPKEKVRARVDRVLDDSGLDYLNAATNDLELKQNNDPGVNTKRDYLATLAEWSGATFFDDCRGRIIFEDYGNRGVAGNAGIWENLPEPWSFYTTAWSTFPSNNAAQHLPGDAIAWTPNWNKNLQTLINDLEIEYKNEAVIQLADQGSITQYGRRRYDLVTELEKQSDATARGTEILAAQANPLWDLGRISILMDRLSTQQRDAALALLSGTRIIIDDLPAGGPYLQYQGIVEGWAETYTPGSHVLTLSLSDPRYSYQVVTWGEIDAAITWGDVDLTIQWYNVVVSDDLIGA